MQYWRRRHRRVPPTTLLVATLLFATFLYLFSSKYSLKEKGPDLKHVQYSWTTPDNPYSFPRSGATQFLAYIPHSGFHNQRIELENALVLSMLLNRTLVLPLARLGAHPLPYKPFDELLEKYAQSDKSWLSHCHSADTAANSTVKECRKFERYTHISWQDVVNLTRLEDLGARLVERWNFTESWFGHTLKISSNDTYWLKDMSPYQFQFYDSSEVALPLGKYSSRMSLDELKVVTREYALLHLGTLFGTSRLRLSRAANKALRTQIRSAMAFSNPFLNHLADQVVSYIGGKDTFYAAHLRLSDGLFAEDAIANSYIIMSRLLASCYELTSGTVKPFDGPKELIQTLGLSPSHWRIPIQPLSHVRPLCLSTKVHPPSLSTPLFMATDALDPRTHSALGIFVATFPCLYFLADIHNVAKVLGGVVNPLDASPMTRFLLPFLDALVASKAASVVGTPESTFSRYVEDILWPTEHGIDIAV